jgi:hypothetical protein
MVLTQDAGKSNEAAGDVYRTFCAVVGASPRRTTTGTPSPGLAGTPKTIFSSRPGKAKRKGELRSDRARHIRSSVDFV